MANYCEKCGENFGLWIGSPLVTSKDNKALCYHCGKSLGLSDDMIDFCRKEGYLSICSRMTYEESLSYLKELPNKIKKDTSLAKYNFSYAPCKEIKFDDSNKVFIIPRNNVAKKEKYNSWDYALFKYSQIVSFDLIENGSSIASGGLGRAVVGGLLFGGAGAVVGAVTRSYNELCTELSIKITVKDYSAPAVYVHLVSSGGIMKNTIQYNNYLKIAQDILSKLQIITNNIDSSTTVNTTDLPNKPINAPSSPAFSAADEILKFKKLRDEGIITQAEFEAKKKQLLGIENTVINSSEAELAKQNSDNRDENVREIPEELSAERAEERREAKVEAKQRFDAYGEAHSDERKKLGEEQNALKDQINSLNASLNEQVEATKKEIKAIPEKSTKKDDTSISTSALPESIRRIDIKTRNNSRKILIASIAIELIGGLIYGPIVHQGFRMLFLAIVSVIVSSIPFIIEHRALQERIKQVESKKRGNSLIFLIVYIVVIIISSIIVFYYTRYKLGYVIFPRHVIPFTIALIIVSSIPTIYLILHRRKTS